jgi:hypothetical protein
MLNFKPLGMEDKTLFESYTLCHGYHNIEASFTNNFIWRNAWNTHIATDDDAMYMRLHGPERPFMLTPFLDDCDRSIGPALRACEQHLRDEFGAPLLIRGITKNIKEKIEKDCPNEYLFIERREFFDYVYLSEDLSALRGKKYSAKRNHINALLKAHTTEYRRYTPQDYDDCVSLQEKWVENKGENLTDYKKERVVIERALTHINELNLKCGLLFVDGNLEAFSIGEKFVDDMVIIHIEKANPDIRGSFALINREFVRNEWSSVKCINREEDLGIEGLRKSKMSYYPAYLIEKYDCVRK